MPVSAAEKCGFYHPDLDQELLDLLKESDSKTRALYHIAEKITEEKIQENPFPQKSDFIRLGILLREMKKYDQSLFWFEKAIALGYDQETCYELSSLYKETGNYHKALSVLDRIPVSVSDAAISELREHCRRMAFL